MQKLCPECNYIGYESRGQKSLLIWGIALTIWGAITLLGALMLYSFSVRILASVIWLSFGVVTLYYYIHYPNICPNCKQKKTMIPLDTPKAQALIKDHNLTIPQETSQQSSPKTTQ